MEQRALHDALAWSFFVLTVVSLLMISVPMYLYWKKARWAFAATLATVVFSLVNLMLMGLKLIKHHLAEVLSGLCPGHLDIGHFDIHGPAPAEKGPTVHSLYR